MKATTTRYGTFQPPMIQAGSLTGCLSINPGQESDAKPKARRPFVTVLPHGATIDYPNFPQPGAGRKVIGVANDNVRLYFDCNINLMAVHGRYAPDGLDNSGSFVFDCEIGINDLLILCLWPGHGRLTTAVAVLHKPSESHAVWDRNGWSVHPYNPIGQTFWAQDLGTSIPDTADVRLVRVEKLVDGEWRLCRKVQVDPQAKFVFEPEPADPTRRNLPMPKEFKDKLPTLPKGKLGWVYRGNHFDDAYPAHDRHVQCLVGEFFVGDTEVWRQTNTFSMNLHHIEAI